MSSGQTAVPRGSAEPFVRSFMAFQTARSELMAVSVKTTRKQPDPEQVTHRG